MKGRELEVADTFFKITMLNALERANHVTVSEIDIGFEVTSTLTQTIKERKLSPLQSLNLERNIV